jgi:rhodanese-related sulfurtransferase
MVPLPRIGVLWTPLDYSLSLFKEKTMSHSGQSPELSPAELDALLKAGQITLVDVREPAEFAAERIAGAILHPLSGFDPRALPPGPLVFQCGIGKRSWSALQRHEAAGLPRARHLAGGLAAWKQAGLPTIGG